MVCNGLNWRARSSSASAPRQAGRNVQAEQASGWFESRRVGAREFAHQQQKARLAGQPGVGSVRSRLLLKAAKREASHAKQKQRSAAWLGNHRQHRVVVEVAHIGGAGGV